MPDKQVEGFTRRGRGSTATLRLARQRARTAERCRACRVAGQGRPNRHRGLGRRAFGDTPLAAIPSAAGRTLKEALAGPERQIILEVLESNNWNRNLTADSLGINRTTLYKKMKRLGLEHPQTMSSELHSPAGLRSSDED